MDYAYFNSQPQQYQFGAFPPTPGPSYEAQDDQSTETADIYHNTAAATAAAAAAAANGFSAFDPTDYQFAANGFISHDTPHSQHPQRQDQQSPTDSNHRPSISSVGPDQALTGFQPSPPLSGEAGGFDRQESRSDSEEKEHMTPQQSRRKAQNRAAQRAFRERKERHVKELETKLNSLSAHSSSLLSDNERLKRELQKLATQNEILRATSSNPAPRPPSPIHGPQTYSPTDFSAAVGLDLHHHPLSYASFQGNEGQKLLAAGATWDLIQSHDLFRRGMVDVADVCRRLRGKAACDGRGPAFKEFEVIKAIEESVISGSDELI